MNNAQGCARTHRRAAVFDIGSNSIRYISCDINDTGAEKLTVLSRRLTTTRLAEGIIATNELCGAAMERSLAALSGYMELAREEDATPFAYATSAVRDAKNGREFAARVKRELGLDIDILTGEREAEYAYLGAVGGRAGKSGLVDIGGGSCQVIRRAGGKSFPIGCVRAKELCASAVGLDACRETVFSRCFSLMRDFEPPRADEWLGVGGSITTLAALKLGLSAFDEDAVRAATLDLHEISALADKLYAMGDARKSVPLLRERHDVIIFGALILEYLMRMLDVKTLGTSVSDGMEGYIMYLMRTSVL